MAVCSTLWLFVVLGGGGGGGGGCKHRLCKEGVHWKGEECNNSCLWATHLILVSLALNLHRSHMSLTFL